MTDILMVKVTDQAGEQWNLNLSYVISVQLSTGVAEFDTLYVDRVDGVQTVTLPPGSWVAALANLEADYNTGNRKAAEHLYVGFT